MHWMRGESISLRSRLRRSAGPPQSEMIGRTFNSVALTDGVKMDLVCVLSKKYMTGQAG